MTPPGQDGKRLLVVEDDAVFSGVLARTLRRRGFEVTETAESAQVRAIAESFKPHYALVDLKLPGESGLKVVAYLRQLPAPPRIVVLTGYASIATAIEAIRLGATHYLAKPAQIDEILAALLRDTANPDLEVVPARLSVGRLEWEHIQKVLTENEGNISATARALKMHRRTLQRKLDKRPPREDA